MSSLYFAYGSNMKSSRLEERTPSAKVLGRASIKDKMVAFNKVSKDGSGKANLVDALSNIAWGVLFEIDENELTDLDRVERGYSRQELDVFNEKGEVVHAFTYISTNIDNTLKPYDWYLNLIVDGAIENGLPQVYLEQLRRTQFILMPRKKE